MLIKRNREESEVEGGDVPDLEASVSSLYHAYVDINLGPPGIEINTGNVESILEGLEEHTGRQSARILANYALRLDFYRDAHERYGQSVERAEAGVVELRSKYKQERRQYRQEQRQRSLASVARFASAVLPKFKTP